MAKQRGGIRKRVYNESYVPARRPGRPRTRGATHLTHIPFDFEYYDRLTSAAAQAGLPLWRFIQDRLPL